MERHIVEILVILMRKYPEGAIGREEFEPLTLNLVDQGYSQQEIETALFWYHNRQLSRERDEINSSFSPDAFRVLHEVERTIIKPDAYGYLIELFNLKMITLSELDSIIERSVLFGGRKVDLNDIKFFVAAQIMDQDGGFPLPGLSSYMKTPSNRIQ